MSVRSDFQITVEEEEDNKENEDDEDDEAEEEEAETSRAEFNTQVGKRHRFSLYEKMAAICILKLVI